jgi:hypothetical protein
LATLGLAQFKPKLRRRELAPRREVGA